MSTDTNKPQQPQEQLSIHDKINLKYWLLRSRDRAFGECIHGGKPLKYLNECLRLIKEVSKDRLGYSIRL